MIKTRTLLPLLLVLSVGCQSEPPPEETTPLSFPGTGVGKADIFGRALAGLAAPYEADLNLSARETEFEQDMSLRRQLGWEIAFRVLDDVPLLGLAEPGTDEEPTVTLASGDIPDVPRWQTWYGADEIRRMFAHLFKELSPSERAQRAPFTEEAIEAAFTWNANALDRSERWPLDRFFAHVDKLGVCPEDMDPADCAVTLQSNFSGGTSGNARITYSPSTVKHLLQNYGPLMDCNQVMENLDLSATTEDVDDNFSTCFSNEFPVDSVLIKAHWSRADFGRQVEVHDTSAEALLNAMGPGSAADWGGGDREADPSPDDIFTIRLKNGDIYRLTGFHIMTKELRHWTWITLWWSDKPDEDFGADRPALPAGVNPIWANYKLGIVVDYREQDPNPSAHFAEVHPTLAESIEATSGPYTWLSNPYIEHGRGNARSNCIGCHQHGGAVNGPDLNGDGTEELLDLEMVVDNSQLYPANGREQMRSLFPADYLWSTQRVDNIAQAFRSEAGNFDFLDQQNPEVRAIVIAGLQGDTAEGEGVFTAQCRGCHGADATGIDSAANLLEVTPKMTDQAFAEVLLTGKGAMPSWDTLSNNNLADVMAYIRSLNDIQVQDEP